MLDTRRGEHRLGRLGASGTLGVRTKLPTSETRTSSICPSRQINCDGNTQTQAQYCQPACRAGSDGPEMIGSRSEVFGSLLKCKAEVDKRLGEVSE